MVYYNKVQYDQIDIIWLIILTEHEMFFLVMAITFAPHGQFALDINAHTNSHIPILKYLPDFPNNCVNDVIPLSNNPQALIC